MASEQSDIWIGDSTSRFGELARDASSGSVIKAPDPPTGGAQIAAILIQLLLGRLLHLAKDLSKTLRSLCGRSVEGKWVARSCLLLYGTDSLIFILMWSSHDRCAPGSREVEEKKLSQSVSQLWLWFK